MIDIESINPNEFQSCDDKYISGDFKQILFVKRGKDYNQNKQQKPQYVLSIVSIINNKSVRQGYLYFYVNPDTKTSNFIGCKVREEYRHLGIATFLIANWIKISIQNGYTKLGTNLEQKKPFILYMLKKYGFEISDPSFYDTRSDIVYICEEVDKLRGEKLLLFKNSTHERIFRNSKIYREDNYSITRSGKNLKVIDKILLPMQGTRPANGVYKLPDENILFAKEKAEETINEHKR